MTQEESFKYNTDKFNSHGYFDFYNKHFTNLKDVKNVLEIGIHYGGSLKFLCDYFPNAHIVGLDCKSKNEYDNDRITTIIGDQEKRDDLNKIDGTFDLIIDDGGHLMRQQQISFGALFQKVKSGGIFVIEDLHTSAANFKSWQHHDDKITSLEMVKQLQNGTLTSNYITDEEKEHILSNVGEIEIFSRTECYSKSVTCVIHKR